MGLYSTIAGLSTDLVSLAIDLFHILETRLPETPFTATVTPQSASSPLATILDRQVNIAIMAEHLFTLFQAGLVLDAATELTSVPGWSFFQDTEAHVAGPAPGDVGIAAVVCETPHRVDGADFRPTSHAAT